MRKALGFAAVAAVSVLAMLAVVNGSAHATYAGENGRLAFGININGNTDVYSVLPDGQDLQRLTTDPGFDACAAYSADGSKIAYCSSQSGTIQVWTMNQDGSDKQQVTHMSTQAIFPDFSPDGSKIVFSDRQVPGSPKRNIYVINSDGTGLTQLTSDAGDNAYPAFSPNGSKIVFTSDRTGVRQVWLMHADGSHQRQLTFDPQPKDQVPDWSPDGSKIAYLADTHGIADTVSPSWGDIWVMNADGSGQHALTSGASYYGTAWSPDGTRIATLDATQTTRTLYTVDASDGGDPQALEPATNLQYVPGWQPRGTGSGADDD